MIRAGGAEGELETHGAVAIAEGDFAQAVASISI